VKWGFEMENIKLTDVERQILFNQYLILSKSDIDGWYDKKDFILKAKILYHGYEGLYDEVISIEKSVDSSISDFVLDILSLYNNILVSYQKLTKEEKLEYPIKNIQFDGFDGNEETSECWFCKFFVEDMDRYSDLKQITNFPFNSHMPRLRMYINQLEFAEKIDKELYELNLQDIKDIMNAKRY